MSIEIEKNIQGKKEINNMKRLLGLLGTIMIAGNAIPSVIAAAPNRKHTLLKKDKIMKISQLLQKRKMSNNLNF